MEGILNPLVGSRRFCRKRPSSWPSRGRGAREILDALSALPPKPLPRYLRHATQARATPPPSQRDQQKQSAPPGPHAQPAGAAASPRHQPPKSVRSDGEKARRPCSGSTTNSEIDLFPCQAFASRPADSESRRPLRGRPAGAMTGKLELSLNEAERSRRWHRHGLKTRIYICLYLVVI